ncbi:3-ketoacyl-ACP reductase [bacterium]|nr:3-ketoacyl-ACP reductase [bacterium]
MSITCLITGGSRGIGLGIARALAAEGCGIAVCGMRPAAQVAPAIGFLREGGCDPLYIQADVSKQPDRERLLDAVRERFGALNVLVNNAGIAPRERKDMLHASEKSYDEVMGTNVKGPYFLTQLAARWMIAQRQKDPQFTACIITVTSISATVASTNRGEYCVSKAAASMATKLWAVRLAEFGIRVYEIQPGIIKTDMTAGVEEKYNKLIAEGLLLQPRWGLPQDVGRAAAMLVRGDLPYSTGQAITIDGGLTIARL